jgi:L-ascorbate metabolism protein UlaG (beta-lactamase superfamily)
MKKRPWLMTAGLITSLIFLGACGLMFHPKTGRLPAGERLERIKRSPNYIDGQFQSPWPTRLSESSGSFLGTVWDVFFRDHPRLRPQEPLPAVKTDFSKLDRSKDTVIWLGHSSFFIQLGGLRILLDPVLSDHAAPVFFLNKVFPGTDIYDPEDLPPADYLIISHDHWDHLDYPTVRAIREKVRRVICPLGVGSHLEYWGFPKENIFEGDWYDQIDFPDDELTVTILPARHFSGRLLRRNRTLWAGMALITPNRSIFFSGDSAYGPHFKDIGQKFGSFDLVLLDCGQYDAQWPLVHPTPEETAQAAEDLNAKKLLPAHAGKFAIARHPWDEPFERIEAASRTRDYTLITPRIGEPVWLDLDQKFPPWWKNLK